MRKRIITSSVILLGVVIFGLSCGPNQRILESANENQGTASEPVATNANIAPAESSFEQDLNAMRTADFKFIIVFRRKDGRALDTADKQLVGGTAPQANRRRLSDEGRAVIIGSNFPFVTGAFDGLTGRYTMENHSKPDGGPMFVDAPPKEKDGIERKQ